jgi:hypothetical protein
MTITVKYYGWADQSPPGAELSAPKIHTKAGGVGTYADPISVSADLSVSPSGTIIYIPAFQKYLVVEDGVECAPDCTTATAAGSREFDIWTQSNASTPSATGSPIDKCQTFLETTLQRTVIYNPDANRPVSSEPLFDQATLHCFGYSGQI